MILRRSLFLLLLSFNFLHALPEGKWKMTVMLTESNNNVIIVINMMIMMLETEVQSSIPVIFLR